MTDVQTSPVQTEQPLSPDDRRAAAEIAAARDRIVAQLEKVIVGQKPVIEELLIALFSRGHCLLVGVPGLAKTLLISTLASVLELTFNRVQFTPDLMPSDITGTDILEEDVTTGHRAFIFLKGPIFTNVLLADEINRTPPKTQAALLQAMQEYKVTAGGRTYPLTLPFFVLATQNPIEQEGTYPLPEAQLDRFFFKVRLTYPTHHEIQRIIGTTTTTLMPDLHPVFDHAEAPEKVMALRTLVREVLVAPHIEEYIAALIHATIPTGARYLNTTDTARTTLPKDDYVNRYVSFGSSPRGGQTLLLGAKVVALLDGRANVSYADVDRVAVPALNHRLVRNFAAEAENIDPAVIVERILHSARKLRR